MSGITFTSELELKAFILGLSMSGIPVPTGSNFRTLRVSGDCSSNVELSYKKIIPFGNVETNMDVVKVSLSVEPIVATTVQIIDNTSLGVKLSITREVV